MSRPPRHEIVEVYPCEVHDHLAEIVRQEHVSQAAIAKRILSSPALCKMVDAVADREVEGIRVTITIRG